MNKFIISKSDINNPKIVQLIKNSKGLFNSIEERSDKFVFEHDQSKWQEIDNICKTLGLYPGQLSPDK
jgi:hypothetical protein